MVSHTAIIVDNNEELSNILSDLLKVKNIKTEGICHTHAESIELAKSKKPDIVFWNWDMPINNGAKTLKEIKKVASHPVIVIITEEKIVEEKKLSKYGASYVIFKPFRLKQIMEIIEKLKVVNYSMG